jgi:hypothetical protein
VINPVLARHDVSDVNADFVADPFMLWVNNRWNMFFEVINRDTKKGEIGLATSRDGFEWNYERIVLAEPFHLSYPYVFEAEGEYYMVPESHRAGAIRLYRADEFPVRWKFVCNLLTGPYSADSSIFRYGDRWWLFTETSAEMKSDTLALCYSDDLRGPWHEHAMSPVIVGNGHIARPAGRVLVHENRIFRYAQDCDPTYGTHVRAFEITDLLPHTYKEKQLFDRPILGPSGHGWNACGMHHVDPHLMNDGRWIACVDGWNEVEE